MNLHTKLLIILILLSSVSYATDSTSYWRKQYYDLKMEHEALVIKNEKLLSEIKKPESKKDNAFIIFFVSFFASSFVVSFFISIKD